MNARDRSIARRSLVYADIECLFRSATREGRWTVHPGRPRRVETNDGIYELRSTNVRLLGGTTVVELRSHSPLTVGFARSGKTHVWHGPLGLIVAYVTRATSSEVVFELVPMTGYLRRAQPGLEDQRWTAGLRALGPLTHQRQSVRGMAAGYRLVGRDGQLLVTEQRTYEMAPSPQGRAETIAAWEISLHDNPLPNAWLLGLLLATTMVGRASLR